MKEEDVKLRGLELLDDGSYSIRIFIKKKLYTGNIIREKK